MCCHQSTREVLLPCKCKGEHYWAHAMTVNHLHVWCGYSHLTGELLSAWLLTCRYEEYLDDVIDASDEFHEVSEIMSRHATLLATNVELRQQQQRVTDLAEESRCRSRALTTCAAPHSACHIREPLS